MPLCSNGCICSASSCRWTATLIGTTPTRCGCCAHAQLQRLTCPEAGPGFFSLADTVPAVYGALRIREPLVHHGLHRVPCQERPQNCWFPSAVGLRWSRPGRLVQSRRPARPCTGPLHPVVHVVGPGDVLGAIARDYGVRIGEIKRFNQPRGRPHPRGPEAEKSPGRWAALLPHLRRSNRAARRRMPRGSGTRCKQGESYWTISLQYPQSRSWRTIMRMNAVFPRSPPARHETEDPPAMSAPQPPLATTGGKAPWPSLWSAVPLHCWPHLSPADGLTVWVTPLVRISYPEAWRAWLHPSPAPYCCGPALEARRRLRPARPIRFQLDSGYG